MCVFRLLLLKWKSSWGSWGLGFELEWLEGQTWWRSRSSLEMTVRWLIGHRSVCDGLFCLTHWAFSSQWSRTWTTCSQRTDWWPINADSSTPSRWDRQVNIILNKSLFVLKGLFVLLLVFSPSRPTWERSCCRISSTSVWTTWLKSNCPRRGTVPASTEDQKLESEPCIRK